MKRVLHLLLNIFWLVCLELKKIEVNYFIGQYRYWSISLYSTSILELKRYSKHRYCIVHYYSVDDYNGALSAMCLLSEENVSL